MMPLPPAAVHALRGKRWFECRYCSGVFVLGSKSELDVKDEAKAARRHQLYCAESPRGSAPMRIRLVFSMVDGSEDYDLSLWPYVPPAVGALRFVELQTGDGVPVSRLRLYDHGLGFHTICNGGTLERVETQ